MIHPLLYASLHLDFGDPVHIVGSSLVIGRLSDQLLQLFVRIVLLGVVAVGLHPGEEVVVVDRVLLKGVSRLVGVVHLDVLVVGVDLASALVDRHEDRLDT